MVCLNIKGSLPSFKAQANYLIWGFNSLHMIFVNLHIISTWPLNSSSLLKVPPPGWMTANKSLQTWIHLYHSLVAVNSHTFFTGFLDPLVCDARVCLTLSHGSCAFDVVSEQIDKGNSTFRLRSAMFLQQSLRSSHIQSVWRLLSMFWYRHDSNSL